MSQKVLGSSIVTDNDGELQEYDNLQVPVEEIYNFVTRFAGDVKAFGQDHTFGHMLMYIIERGKAEIERQVKTKAVQEQNRASGQLLKDYNLSPAEARRLLMEALEATRKEKEQVPVAVATNGSH